MLNPLLPLDLTEALIQQLSEDIDMKNIYDEEPHVCENCASCEETEEEFDEEELLYIE